MPVVFLTNASTSPWTRPADWSDASHTVELVGCGGRGGAGTNNTTTYRSGAGGGGGGYAKLSYSSGALASTTPFQVSINNTSTTDRTTAATCWLASTFSNTLYVESGEAGDDGNVGTTGGVGGSAATTSTGSPSGPVYSASNNFGGGVGGAVAAVTASGGGGGGAGGPSQSGGAGGSSTSSTNGGGGGGGANNNTSGSNAGSTSGGNGSGGNAGGSSGTPAGANGSVDKAGGGGGFFSAVASATTTGGTGFSGNALWTQTSPSVTAGPGAGGGGGGGNSVNSGSPTTSGGNGGSYGGGGGGAGGFRFSAGTKTQGTGASGLIVITYTASTLVTGTLGSTEAADTAAFPSGTVAWNTTLAAQEGNVYALLLHFDGANASTTIVDSGGKNQTVTAHGGAKIDTSQLVFSNSALTLPASGDYLDVAFSLDFIFASADFTIDFRARLSSGSTAQTFYDGGPGGFKIFYDGTALKFTSAAGTITGGGLSSNTNYHIAVTRAAGSTRLFKDGVQQGSTLSDATSYVSGAGYPQIGDGVVVTSGTLAVTEASDTPVFTGTAVFPAVTGTLVVTEASDTGAFAGSVTVPLDSATTAWIAVVGSGNVDVNHAGYVNTLIVGLKADGIWSKLDRLWLFAAQNTNSALIDLVATSSATNVNSTTFTTDRGYTGNGSTMYIDSNFNPSTGTPIYGANSACVFAWSNTSGADNGAIIGVSSANLTRIYPQYSDTNCYWGLNSGGSEITGGLGGPAGLWTVNRSGGAAQQLYINGSSMGTGTTSTLIVPNSNIFVLQEAGAFSPRQVCCFGAGGSLNSTEQSNLRSRLRTYMTSVGVP